MSRIGKMPVAIPKGVEVKSDGGRVRVKGPKGELSSAIPSGLTVTIADGQVNIARGSDEPHARAIHEYCFGTIWDRPHLDLKTRELIVIAAAVASDCPNEVALHARGALNRGAKREEIVETILQCAPYVGFPKTNHALKAAKDVFDRWEAKKEDWKAL